VRIFHFIYDHMENPWVGGGGAVRAHEIYRRLSERHDIAVVCGKYPGAEDYQEGRLSFHFAGTPRNNYVLSTFCYAARAARWLRERAAEADVVVEDFASFNPMFSYRIARRPPVLQLHHREGREILRRYGPAGIPFYLIEKFYPARFRHVVCVSEASRAKFGIPFAEVIPNGIDARLLEAPSGGESDGACFLGRLHIHNKGLDTLVEAAASSGVRVVIAGRGRDEGRLREMVREKGAAGRVEFRGFIPEEEKAEFFSGSGFLVLPSRYEGQGIVLLEAAACGRPVLVSDIPELAFAVEAGFGVSFKTGDAADLAEKLRLLSGDPGLRREMGMKGRRFAEGYTWERIAGRFEEFLVKVLAEAAGVSVGEKS